jgi:hypothetical protein
MTRSAQCHFTKTEDDPCLQAATVIWVVVDATSWVETLKKYQRMSQHWKSLRKKDDSKAWKTTKVASIHQTRETVHYQAD